FEPSASKSFDELQSAVEIIAPRAPVASTYVKSSSVEETATTTPITNVSATRTRQREPAPDASTNQRATMSRDRSDSSGLKKIEVETKAISVAEDLLGDGKKNARERDRGIEAYSPAHALQYSARKNLRPTEQRSSNPPTIRVTIGRVEVRAI